MEAEAIGHLQHGELERRFDNGRAVDPQQPGEQLRVKEEQEASAADHLVDAAQRALRVNLVQHLVASAGVVEIRCDPPLVPWTPTGKI